MGLLKLSWRSEELKTFNCVETAEGEVVKEFKPQSYKSLMTTQEADTLRMFMTEVVERGTATKLKGLSYTAAGKTGSAEYNKVKEDSHAWFTGFAPAEDPEISVWKKYKGEIKNINVYDYADLVYSW